MENFNIANFLKKEEISLYHKGLNFQSYKILGSNFIKSGAFKGVTCFAVWAPNAKSVSVIGDFNNWNEGSHIMKKNPDSGIWVLFIKNLKMGSRYKYYILSEDNKVLIKTDPFSTYYSSAPDNCSIIHDINNYKWNDDEWMSRRSKINYEITK